MGCVVVRHDAGCRQTEVGGRGKKRVGMEVQRCFVWGVHWHIARRLVIGDTTRRHLVASPVSTDMKTFRATQTLWSI
jgi:hypothetical protein